MTATCRHVPGEGRPAILPLFLSLLLFLATGCIPLAERSPVAVDLPLQFSATGQDARNTEWWLDFRDDALNLLMQQALTDNLSLQATREKIAAAAAVSRQSRAALFPALDAEGGISSTRNYQSDTTSNSFFTNLIASYELDLWNRLGSLRDAADLEFRATAADYQAAAISLSAQVAITWYQLTEKQLQRELVIRQQETNKKILTLIDIQFRSGLVPITDVLQQQQLIESNSGEIAALKAEIRTLQNQLAILQAIVPTGYSPPSASDLPALPPLPETGIPAEILQNRPDLRSSFLQLQAADKQVSAAVANQYPRLAITAELTTSAANARDLFDNWFTTLAGNLFGPLFDAGSRKAAVLEKEAVARQLFLNYRQATLEAISEVEDALIQEKQKQEVLASERRRLELATQTVSRLSVRYRQGVADYQEVLLALRSQQGLEQSILTSRRQLLELRIGLYRALSGRLLLDDNQHRQPSEDHPEPHNISNSTGESAE